MDYPEEFYKHLIYSGTVQSIAMLAVQSDDYSLFKYESEEMFFDTETYIKADFTTTLVKTHEDGKNLDFDTSIYTMLFSMKHGVALMAHNSEDVEIQNAIMIPPLNQFAIVDMVREELNKFGTNLANKA